MIWTVFLAFAVLVLSGLVGYIILRTHVSQKQKRQKAINETQQRAAEYKVDPYDPYNVRNIQQ